MSDRSLTPPLAGRVLGWVLVLVVVTCAARLIWEFMWPLLPLLVCVLVVAGAVWFVVNRSR